MYKTEGIILKKIDVGETDELVTLYTKDFGNMRALARGVKKPSAKLRGHLESLSLSSIQFVIGKYGNTMTHALMIRPLAHVKSDPARYAYARYAADMMLTHTLEGQKDERLWNLFAGSVLLLDEGAFISDPDYFLRSFDEGLLSSLGHEGEKDIRVLGNTVIRPRVPKYDILV